jgi:hypothetical protein
MEATHNGRVYKIVGSEEELVNLRISLIERGFDGRVYYGLSQATGRQRKNFSAVFYRSAKSGHFTFLH